MKVSLGQNSSEFIHTLKSMTEGKKVLFACVGTDRSTGDALGALVGTSLESLGYDVIGTIDYPLHATNLAERIASAEQLHIYNFIVAVDASLGRIDSVGKICLADKPLKAGAGVGKNLPEVGDCSLTGVVNVGGFMEYMVLQNTRLSVVMRMARQIVDAIQMAVPLEERADTYNIA